MSAAYWAYKALGTAGLMALMPSWWLHHLLKGRDIDRFHQRIGLYPRDLRQQLQLSHAIWLHAVSVGEVGVAAPIIEAVQTIRPGCRLALSATTRQGLNRARFLFGKGIPSFYAPLDVDGPNQIALRMIQPRVLGLLETEIWPNLIIAAHRRGIRIALLNGRISVRSIKRYLKIRPLMRHTLAHVDVFSMISAQDAERIASLGAPQDRIVVNGNAKFDGAAAIADTMSMQWAASLYNLQPGTPVMVAGSTRNPEEIFVLDAFESISKAYPETILILAPRHTGRVPQIESWIRERGWPCQRRSQIDGERPRKAKIVILDTMGELSATYGIADFVFCGGSLVPRGGQNVLEPANWGKAVMHGPSMEDFAEACGLIGQAGGSAVVHNAREIAAVALRWLQDPQTARAMGHAARGAIQMHRGAAAKHAEVLNRLLSGAVQP
jgi:3-deoxy-D-manno-octulosonic-acid transferase